ncbi:2-oxo-3-hexenedioate decarboxylase [Arthrobacter pascens]|uniref:2-keto-4-pentenoate hydratase n=1 Tax=Arthrobacter pascens TaxID=1677 RepID=UPI00278714D8|nr:fumarylacetoacetate hydrolase family protein [Arthrobacter pascens]MDQ0634319.1 2-oxo-3-hexenedioate decarboxylase [Arthrobacter pascens]
MSTTLNEAQLEHAAASLDSAQLTGQAVEQFGDSLDLDQAYSIQNQLLELRRNRGERSTGRKLGFTSEAKMAQMGVSELIVGFLTDAMEISDGGSLSLKGLVHPRVEPEIAFRLSTSIGPESTEEQFLAAVEAVAPALEVIDSRYQNFRFSLPDVVADNTSACRYVIGPWQPMTPKLAGRAVALKFDGAPAAEGSTSDILGDPLLTLPRLLAMSAKYGFTIPAGSVILAGAATAAVALTPGALVSADIEGLGTVSLNVEAENND